MSNKVVIRLTADNKELKRKLESARKDLGKFGKKSEGVFKKISKSFGALGIAGGLAGLSYVLKNAIKGFAAFGRTISIATKRLGFNAETMKKVRSELTLLAKEGLGSHSDLADALNFIAQTPKVLEENVNKTLRTIAKLAAVTGDGMVELADRVTDAMELFGIAGDDVDLFSAKLAAVANQANTTVLELAEALKKSAGFRRFFSADEALATASVFSKAYKGEQGGTYLKAFYSGFSKQSTRDALSESGIDFFRDGSVRDLIDVMRDIADKLSGTQEEQAEFLESLGLSRKERTAFEDVAERPEDLANVLKLISETNASLLDRLIPQDFQRAIAKVGGSGEAVIHSALGESEGILTGILTIFGDFLDGLWILIERFKSQYLEIKFVLVGIAGLFFKSGLLKVFAKLLLFVRWFNPWVLGFTIAIYALGAAVRNFGKSIRDTLYKYFPEGWANKAADWMGIRGVDSKGEEKPSEPKPSEPKPSEPKPLTPKEEEEEYKRRYSLAQGWISFVSSSYDKLKGIVETFFAMERQNINQNYALAVRALDAEIAKRREAGEDEVLLAEEREKRLAELQAEKEKSEKELFEKQKAMSIAMVVISTMIGLTNAMASIWSPTSPYDPIAKGIMSAVTGTLMLAQMAVSIAMIASQEYIPTAHSGGMVGAEGLRPLSNERDYRLEVGETVRTARQEEALRGRFGGGLSMPLVNKISIDGKRFASIMSRIQEENRIS